MIAINLKCEFLSNPIGIDLQNPLLSWNCKGDVTQTAYRVIAKENGVVLWDSEKVKSSKTRVYYPLALKSRQRIDWGVTLWNENDLADSESVAFFETGLLTKSDWKAKWITGNYLVNPFKRYPVDYFKTNFQTSDIASARLYATALGVYEASLNGQRVGDFILAPGHTDYNKRVQYQTYDVTNLLNNGENHLTVCLADGWYRGSCGAWGLKNQYGNQTKFLLQLEITKTNGCVQTIVSNNDWKWCNDGEITFADNKDGECVNTNLVPSFNGKAKVTKCKITPTASNNVFVTEHETFKPTLITTPNG